jgi:hypothetical protein
MPQRLEFYEHWLSSDGLRDGSIGLAPITAVLGFLRTEGDAYDAVMERAGELAAAWTVLSLSPGRRKVMAWLPRRWRARAALRVAAGIVTDVQGAGRARTRLRGRTANVELAASLFCTVREKSRAPLCRFYLAMTLETLRQFGIAAVGRPDRCRAIDGATCLLVLELGGARTASEPAMAA